jgi:hypothetical protein
MGFSPCERGRAGRGKAESGRAAELGGRIGHLQFFLNFTLDRAIHS